MSSKPRNHPRWYWRWAAFCVLGLGALRHGGLKSKQIDFPADLFGEIQRAAAEEGWPLSKAVILLTKLGAKAQKQAEQAVRSAHLAFMNETDPQAIDKRGDEMIKAIFGPDAIG